MQGKFFGFSWRRGLCCVWDGIFVLEDSNGGRSIGFETQNKPGKEIKVCPAKMPGHDAWIVEL